MKINIIAVGKVKEKYFEEGIKEYSKRLSRFCEFKIIEIKEHTLDSPSSSEINIILKKEAELIKAELKGIVIVLAIEGKQFSSEEFSAEISNILVSGNSDITFVIGSSHGLDDSIKNKANQKISFSKMTFPHTLARLILTEQIYRAFMITNNTKYHK